MGKKTLQSMSPMMAFPIQQGNETLYVLMEGNGRVGGLKSAVDLLTSMHSDFVTPRLTIDVVNPGQEDKHIMLMKNLRFFLVPKLADPISRCELERLGATGTSKYED